VLLGLAEFSCLIGIPVTLVGFLIQAARKRPNKKIWGGVCIGFLAVFVVCVIATPTSPSDDSEVAAVESSVAEETAVHVETETPQEETVAPTESDSFVFTAKELYDVGENYIGQEVTVKGTISEISEFSDMNGYYLYGTKGQGVVVWVYETSKSHKTDDEVEFTGTVQNAGGGQVEITENSPSDSDNEVSSEAETILMMIAEDVAVQIAQNPSTVEFSTFEWAFAHEGDTYKVQGTFSCSNLYGVSESHVLQVWCDETDTGIAAKRVFLDGTELNTD